MDPTKHTNEDPRNDERQDSGSPNGNNDFVDDVPTKKRKLQMNSIDCENFLSDGDGSKALTDPASVKFSSKDPNRGLYPRPSQKHRPGQFCQPGTMGNGFVTAREVLNPTLPFVSNPVEHQSHTVSIETTKKYPPWKQATKSKLPGQNNTLDKYCVKKNSGHDHLTSPVKNGADLPKRTVMYSPVKKANCSQESIIYLSDSPPSSQPASQSTTEKNESVKKLFDAQIKSKIKSTKSAKSRSKKSKKEATFNRENAFLYSNDPVPQNTKMAKGDRYGLLGSGSQSNSDSEDYDKDCFIDDLPDELLEIILCRLPLMDLCSNVNLVCKRWNQIISNEIFVPWKKRYHKLKMKESSTLAEFQQLMNNHEMTTPSRYFGGLVHYVKDFKPITAKNMLSCLQHHPKYKWAYDLMVERFPDCLSDKVPSPWSMIILLCIISETVRDIEDIFTVMLSPNSQCTAHEIMEILYCAACFLYCFKENRFNESWNGVHYRVFYALYLYENESCFTTAELESVFRGTSGQQSIMRYSKSTAVKYTHEQLRICSHDVKKNDIVKIVAFAGTGKTTTLVRYTQLRPNKRFLLLVYNKSVQTHASTQFPGNVTSRTGHSLGYQHFGFRYRNAGKLRNLSVSNIINVVKTRKGESLYVQAKFVLNTVNTFLASDDPEISLIHVPDRHFDEKKNALVFIDESTKRNLCDDAKLVWSIMKDLNDKRVGMSHDGYLKLYQLSRPNLSNYDVLLIDEAQDLTPAVAAIVLQQSKPKILVGDPHQQIYGFRGAVNAMDGVNASHTFYLTQSFRFGPEIAFVASTCLEYLKGERKKTLVGNKHPGGIHGDQVGQLAVITRSNFELFNEAVKKCCFSQENVRVAFAGGLKNFGFDKLHDMYLLMLPEEERAKKGGVKDAFLVRFPNIGELEKYAKKTMDNELLGKLKIVRTFNTQLPSHMEKIKSKTTEDERTADIIYSTAHKAKGLEFSTVRLTDDFNALPQGLAHGTGQPAGSEDESNLLYVAVTRAKKRLILTRTLISMLKAAGERFHYPDYTKPPDGEKNPAKLKCMLSDREFVPNTLTLTQREVKLAEGRSGKEAGQICPQLIREEYPNLCALYGSLVDERTPEEIENHRALQEQHDDSDDDLPGWMIMDHNGMGINMEFILAGVGL